MSTRHHRLNLLKTQVVNLPPPIYPLPSCPIWSRVAFHVIWFTDLRSIPRCGTCCQQDSLKPCAHWGTILLLLPLWLLHSADQCQDSGSPSPLRHNLYAWCSFPTLVYGTASHLVSLLGLLFPLPSLALSLLESSKSINHTILPACLESLPVTTCCILREIHILCPGRWVLCLPQWPPGVLLLPSLPRFQAHRLHSDPRSTPSSVPHWILVVSCPLCQECSSLRSQAQV